MSWVALKSQYYTKARNRKQQFHFDPWLLGCVCALLALGLVMVSSASISVAERQLQDPFYYTWRQLAYIVFALSLAGWVLRIPISRWEAVGPYLLIIGIFLLVLVLVIGHQVNGSKRWIPLAVANIQPSEFMKLFVIVFLSGYLVRRGEEVRNSVKGFMKPMMLLAVIGILLLLEPDFGAAFVITATALGMMYLGGVQLRQFLLLFVLAALGFAIVAYSSAYRLERITCFLNPWAQAFDCGFQLTQSLIAFGRGEWLGVGLGGSIQKLFYLPEAHTDFLYAVLSEELGLLGGVFVILMFSIIVVRAFSIGHKALGNGYRFAAYLAYGLGLLIGLQAFINIGVNMGVLPTKGLTLPLMSYGGSSVVVTCLACAILLRIHHEHRPAQASYRN